MEPAATVIKIMGGVANVANIISHNQTTVRRWTYPRGRSSGTGGLIPAEHQATLLAEAKRRGLPLTADLLVKAD